MVRNEKELSTKKDREDTRNKLKNKKRTFLELDDKSIAVFKRKGYEILEKLGEGAFGQVFKARQLGKTALDGPAGLCAVKVMYLDKMPEKIRTKFLPREILALMEAQHVNIIRVHDIIRANQKIYVFMEFAGEGDLSAYVKKHKILQESLARHWFKQIADAMLYLHAKLQMAHRDIKLDNILLDHNFDAKITDFGFASMITAENADPMTYCSKTFCGTVPYYCPELVSKVPYNPFKADVWAMGVVLYAMANNRFPFHYHDTKKMLVEQKDYPKYIRSRFGSSNSAELKELLEIMFNPKEASRCSTEDIINSAWININDLQRPAPKTIIITSSK